MSLSTRHSDQVVVVIPAFNEEFSLREVIRSVLPYSRIIIVDDGSTDNTGKIAKNEGCEVVVHSMNQGYDKALESGMQKALELGFDSAITMDADGQHGPEIINNFITEFNRGADLVVGIRNKKQRIAELLFAWVSILFWGINDPLCGMKGYRLHLLRLAGRFDTYGSIGTELAIRAAKSGFTVHQIPIIIKSRDGKPRFGSGLRPNLKILRALLYALNSKKLK